MTDHKAEALSKCEQIAGVDEQTNQITLAIEAQVHATLALVDAVDRLANSFGICDHGYTICPYCIRSALEGTL